MMIPAFSPRFSSVQAEYTLGGRLGSASTTMIRDANEYGPIKGYLLRNNDPTKDWQFLDYGASDGSEAVMKTLMMLTNKVGPSMTNFKVWVSDLVPQRLTRLKQGFIRLFTDPNELEPLTMACGPEMVSQLEAVDEAVAPFQKADMDHDEVNNLETRTRQGIVEFNQTKTKNYRLSDTLRQHITVADQPMDLTTALDRDFPERTIISIKNSWVYTPMAQWGTIAQHLGRHIKPNSHTLVWLGENEASTESEPAAGLPSIPALMRQQGFMTPTAENLVHNKLWMKRPRA